MLPFFDTHMALERVTSQSAAPVSSHDALFWAVFWSDSFALLDDHMRLPMELKHVKPC